MVLVIAVLISVQESRLARCAVELDVFVVLFASVCLSVVPDGSRLMDLPQEVAHL